MFTFPNKTIVFLTTILVLTGCATSRSVLDVQVPTSPAAQTNGKKVYVNSVTDNRGFQATPSTPDIPSLDPSEDQSDAIKSRAIGRKRNGYGKALGDMLLKDGETVQTITYKSIQEAFTQKGYTVLSKKEDVTKDTFVVDANVDKFWAWMNPGFWSITLSSEISTDISIKAGKTTTPLKVSVKAADGYQVATEKNWTEIIQNALKLYVEQLKSKIN